jgi:sulfate transport system ATP-binding protein
VQDGRLKVGDVAVAETGDSGADLPAGVVYVRPHDVEVAREAANGDAIPARVDHVSFAGPFVQVQLTRADSQESLEAALTRERYRELSLKVGDAVYVRFRNARMFVEDYSI